MGLSFDLKISNNIIPIKLKNCSALLKSIRKKTYIKYAAIGAIAIKRIKHLLNLFGME